MIEPLEPSPLRPIDARNRDALDAWLWRLCRNERQPDPRDPDLRRRGRDVEWNLSRARAWLEARERQLDAVAAVLAEEFGSPFERSNVVPFQAARK